MGRTASTSRRANGPLRSGCGLCDRALYGRQPGTCRALSLVSDAYRGFDHPDTAPLPQIGQDLFILELFHGPTLAFKDFAMQVLSRLMERALKRTGARTTIVGATSGDTGA